MLVAWFTLGKNDEHEYRYLWIYRLSLLITLLTYQLVSRAHFEEKLTLALTLPMTLAQFWLAKQNLDSQ